MQFKAKHKTQLAGLIAGSGAEIITHSKGYSWVSSGRVDHDPNELTIPIPENTIIGLVYHKVRRKVQPIRNSQYPFGHRPLISEGYWSVRVYFYPADKVESITQHHRHFDIKLKP
jgi:hypothetical protein